MRINYEIVREWLEETTTDKPHIKNMDLLLNIPIEYYLPDGICPICGKQRIDYKRGKPVFDPECRHFVWYRLGVDCYVNTYWFIEEFRRIPVYVITNGAVVYVLTTTIGVIMKILRERKNE